MTGAGSRSTAKKEPAALAGLQEPSGHPGPRGEQQPADPPPTPGWRKPSTMDTSASIASDLPQHQTPIPCARKRASANIFHGVGLWQLRRLFHSTGDAEAEERAQLVWECAENRCLTQALKQLHRRQRKMKFRSHRRPPSDKRSSARLLELQHFGRLCIEDCSTSGADVDSSSSKNTEAPDQAGYPTSLHYRKKGGMGAANYLHQLHW
ncbi:hypothetical protein JRQ81_018120 [Phrynocephalus forsythii]|uniref:Arginine vasopressin-induced protein 1 n=1 Tax=Phrynocephalus forsythii TaxID=171643 RepID=A0A9Q0XU59_9SAUR|nr:hypothetical protein JRQ81_018120 [Phrynocephalus forsythii]